MSDQPTAKDRAVDLSRALQAFHRALIRSEVGDDPTLANPYTQLFALISDPRFVWMAPVSELIARIDQHVADEDVHVPEILEGLHREAAALIGEGDGRQDPAFRLRHLTAIQKDADVGIATGRLRRVVVGIPRQGKV